MGTGNGLLLLRQVQAPGRKRVSAAEISRGRRLRQGEVFDQFKECECLRTSCFCFSREAYGQSETFLMKTKGDST